MNSILKESLCLFLLVGAIYLTCAAGYLDTIDAEPSLRTAHALVDSGSFRTEPEDEGLKYYLYYRSPRGGWYTKMGLSLPLLYVPCVLAAKAAASVTGLSESLLSIFLVSLVNSLLTATIVALLFLFLRFQGSQRREALLIALSAGLATLLFPYSKTTQREPFQALCLLAMLTLPLLPARPRRRPVLYFCAGTFAALGFLSKLALVFPICPILLFLMWKSAGERHSRNACWLSLGAPLAMGAAVWALFSHYAYGGAMKPGYGYSTVTLKSAVWANPFWSGIHAQLFSLSSGLLFYSPVLLVPLAVTVWKARQRSLSSLDLAAWATILAQLALYARWCDPTGGMALGPRYLVAVVPLFFLLFSGIPSLTLAPAWVKLGAGALLLWSLAVQAVSVGVKAQQYWTLQERAGETLYLPQWMANFRFCVEKWRGRPEIYKPSDFGGRSASPVDLTTVRTLIGFNFWWLHARRMAAASIPPGRRAAVQPQALGKDGRLQPDAKREKLQLSLRAP